MEELVQVAFKRLREIKSVCLATVDQGQPAARVVDVMGYDADGLYFLSARGKPMFRQLRDTGRVALCALGPDYVMIRVSGEMRKLADPKLAARLVEANPVLRRIYPGNAIGVLEPFQLHRGRGELFDLSSGVPTRRRFAFGGAEPNPSGYRINGDCIACGLCRDACPVGAVSEGDPYTIEPTRCLECGSCAEICPVSALEPAASF